MPEGMERLEGPMNIEVNEVLREGEPMVEFVLKVNGIEELRLHLSPQDAGMIGARMILLAGDMIRRAEAERN